MHHPQDTFENCHCRRKLNLVPLTSIVSSWFPSFSRHGSQAHSTRVTTFASTGLGAKQRQVASCVLPLSIGVCSPSLLRLTALLCLPVSWGLSAETKTETGADIGALGEGAPGLPVYVLPASVASMGFGLPVPPESLCLLSVPIVAVLRRSPRAQL